MNFIDHLFEGAPYGDALYLCIVLIIVCWVLSIVTREYSWVDRIWSIVPAVYCLMVAIAQDFEDTRVNVMTILVCCWGARLTANYAVKGGYWKGGEDYRWVYLRSRLSKLQFQLMNIFVTAIGQLLIVWMFTSPIHQAWLAWQEAQAGQSAPPLWNWLDWVALCLFVGFLAVETIADYQMLKFQNTKKRKLAAGEEVAQPFINHGLFAYSRHPSYLSEMIMWLAFYLFAIAASKQVLDWTGIGWLLLVMTFIGSTRLSENISASKYPTYEDYQRTVPKFIPFIRFMQVKS